MHVFHREFSDLVSIKHSGINGILVHQQTIKNIICVKGLLRNGLGEKAGGGKGNGRGRSTKHNNKKTSTLVLIVGTNAVFGLDRKMKDTCSSINSFNSSSLFIATRNTLVKLQLFQLQFGSMSSTKHFTRTGGAGEQTADLCKE